jgi:hypothetical protein
MTLLQQLQAHKGGLIHLKTQLYWYGVGYDKNPGRVCLVLDIDTTETAAATGTTAAATAAARGVASTLLLIDGSPQWIWIDEEDVEIMLEDPSTHTHACMQEVSTEQKRQHSLGSSRASAD